MESVCLNHEENQNEWTLNFRMIFTGKVFAFDILQHSGDCLWI